ncbi:MAG TPA: hypothetical protein VIJ00_03765 [Nakamurella sp.]
MPAGVPTGGRFAASRHADPGTDLLGAGSERELFGRFNASARHWGNRLGVDVEDLLQDTAVEFYATLARRRTAGDPRPGLNGREVTVRSAAGSGMVNPGGWIHRIAYNIAARRVAGTDRSADLAALREFRVRRDEVENRWGRGLSQVEADRLADEIRLARPPRRRPAPGFHRRVRTVSTDVMEQDWDVPAEPDPVDGGEFAAHTAGAVAESLLAGEGRSGRAAAQGLAWDVVAEVTGAPVVVPGVLDPAVARRAARRVQDAGGASVVARAVRDGVSEEDVDAVEALCVPFGRLDEEERAAVVRTVRRSGGYGDQVWSAALRAATYRPGR